MTKAKTIKWEQGEIRVFEDGIDEIVAENVDIHIERMSDSEFWMGITPRANGKLKLDERLHVLFNTKRTRVQCQTYGDKVGWEF